MRILVYSLMPNHWHLVLHPRGDGDRSKFMRGDGLLAATTRLDDGRLRLLH